MRDRRKAERARQALFTTPAQPPVYDILTALTIDVVPSFTRVYDIATISGFDTVIFHPGIGGVVSAPRADNVVAFACIDYGVPVHGVDSTRKVGPFNRLRVFRPRDHVIAAGLSIERHERFAELVVGDHTTRNSTSGATSQ